MKKLNDAGHGKDRRKMMKRSIRKTILASLLATVMMLTVMPSEAYAAGVRNPEEIGPAEETGEILPEEETDEILSGEETDEILSGEESDAIIPREETDGTGDDEEDGQEDALGDPAMPVSLYVNDRADHDEAGRVLVDPEHLGGSGWSYDIEHNALTLSGFNGSEIYAQGGGLTILLSGTNTITVPAVGGTGEYAIAVKGSSGDKLKIDKAQGASTAILNVNLTGGQNTDNDNGLIRISTYALYQSQGTTEILGGTVNISGTSTGRISGFGSSGIVSVNNDANLSMDLSSENAGIGADTLRANTSGTVSISVTGTALDTLHASGSGEITLTSGNNCNAINGWLDVGQNAGKITLNGPVCGSLGNMIQLTEPKQFIIPGNPDYTRLYDRPGLSGTAKKFYLVDSEGELITQSVIDTVEDRTLKVMDSDLFNAPEGTVGTSIASPASSPQYAVVGGTVGHYSNDIAWFRLKEAEGNTLPSGLTIDQYTGEITGTPKEASAAGSVIVEAYDRYDSSNVCEFTVAYGAIVELPRYITVGSDEINRKESHTGTGYSYDGKGTLTLNNYNGSSITSDGALKILLNGTNTITVPAVGGTGEYAIAVRGSGNDRLLIDKAQGATTAILNVNLTGGKNPDNEYGLIRMSTNSNYQGQGTTEILGGTVRINGGSTNRISGFGSSSYVYVKNDANLSMNLSSENAGIGAATLYAETSGNISIAVTGTALDTLRASGSGEVTLTSGNGGNAISGWLDVKQTAGKITLHGPACGFQGGRIQLTEPKQFSIPGDPDYTRSYLRKGLSGTAQDFYLADSEGELITESVIDTVEDRTLKVMDSDLFNAPEGTVGTSIASPASSPQYAVVGGTVGHYS
ncbi:MAG: putative Ig domain-containing protein, partial [Lachnospiraceae bacterium]|nr:putative Ig domain-containing protein [Lachnospiraceae bacterium]